MKKRFLLLPGLLIVGCRGGATGYVPTPTPKVEPVSMNAKASELMPLEVGNRWVYQMRVGQSNNGKATGSSDQTVSYRVDSKRGDGAALLVMEQDGRVIDRQYWRTSDQGLFLLTGGTEDVPYTPPQPIAVLPLEAGKKFHWAGKGIMPSGQVSVADALSEIDAPQTVDTGIKTKGSVSAIPITTRTKYANGGGESIYWFTPGIGLVRYRQESVDGPRRTVIVLTLTDYTKSK